MTRLWPIPPSPILPRGLCIRMARRWWHPTLWVRRCRGAAAQPGGHAPSLRHRDQNSTPLPRGPLRVLIPCAESRRRQYHFSGGEAVQVNEGGSETHHIWSGFIIVRTVLLHTDTSACLLLTFFLPGGHRPVLHARSGSSGGVPFVPPLYHVPLYPGARVLDDRNLLEH